MIDIYQLEVTLRDSKPPIWRRLVVPGNLDLRSTSNPFFENERAIASAHTRVIR